MDDQGAIVAGLFLKSGVAVVPVGAALAHREGVVEALPRFDAMKAYPRHPVHGGRQHDTVPVEGGVLGELIGYPQAQLIAFAPVQGRPRQAAVDGGGETFHTGEIHALVADAQIEARAGQFRDGNRSGRRRQHAAAREGRAGGGEPGDEAAPRQPYPVIRQQRLHGRAPGAYWAARARISSYTPAPSASSCQT